MIRFMHPYRLAMDDVRETDIKLENALAEVKRIETRIAEASERNDPFEVREALTNSWKASNDWLRSLRHGRAIRIQELLPARKQIAQVGMERGRVARETLVEMISSLRGELGLSPDKSLFLKEQQETEDRAKQALQDTEIPRLVIPGK